MFTIQEYVQPETVEEAYRLLMAKRNNVILGGTAFLKMSNKKIGTGIDLTKLSLDYIKETETQIEIGAMTTFRSLETSQCLKKNFNRLIPKSVEGILGVQFRNVVTIGGTVYSRYGFSDLITGLLALDVTVTLHGAGTIPLDEFLKKGSHKDILTRVNIEKNKRIASYQMLRNSAGDYPILNTAVSRLNNEWKIVIGARPRRAEVAMEASKFLSNHPISDGTIEEAAKLAVKELAFGSNMRGSKTYREAIAVPLVKRSIREVLR